MAELISTYLRNLKFDPRLLNSFIAKYLSNLRIVILLTIAIVAFGIISYNSLPRKLNPDIKIPIVLVSTVLPGAGPADIESLVSIKVEDAVRGIAKVKKVQSTSRDSVSLVNIEFESGVDPEKAKADVSSVVDGITDLPEDAQKPTVQKLDFENQPIWVFNLAGGQDRASLIRFAKNLSQDLEDLSSIDKVSITGLDEAEVQVVIKPEAIAAYQINPMQLTGLIKNALNTFPGGSVKTANSSFSLTIDPEVVRLDDLRNINLILKSQVIKLSDIAIISEKSKPDQAQSFITSKALPLEPSVSFNIFRVNTVNIDKAESDAKKLIEDKLKDQNNRFNVYTVQNAAEQIDKEFAELQRDMGITIFLVFLILLIFLGIRQAMVAMLSIPLTFLITFIVMNITGIALTFIATFSLLLSLGLLVDDTIVVISAMSAYFRTGKFAPFQTGLLVWKDFWVAILTTTVTTVWAFIPLLLSTGIIGEFIKPIPIVVSSTLLGSIVVALFITMPLMIFLLKPLIPYRIRIFLRILLLILIILGFYFLVPKNNLILFEILAFLVFLLITYQVRRALFKKIAGSFSLRFKITRFGKNIKNSLNRGFISFQKIDSRYLNLIRRILASPSARRKTIIMVIIFSVFSYLLVPLGFVKNEFFPKTDEDFMYISVELPSGTNLETAKIEGLEVLEKLKSTPDAKFVTLEQGQSFNAEMGTGSSESNNFLYSIALEEKRPKSSLEIAQILREKFSDYAAGKLSVIEVSGGPPAGADLQIKLFGPDLRTLNQYAKKIQDYLKTQQGVTNIDQTIKPGTSKLAFVPDKEAIALNNLTLETIGFWLRLFATGFKADTIKLDETSNKDQDITLRLKDSSQLIQDVSSLNIPTPSGLVPITSLGKLELRPNPTLITREDGKRTLSVVASVTPGFNLTSLNQGLEKYADSLGLPPGYGWATGGVNEENQKSVNSIIMAMGLSFVLILLTMVLQFSSFRRALIVMLVIPLSISGVFIIFALSNTPLSFPALIGILALFGIVVKNSILVVDKIVINNKSGLSFTESIADAAASRLEPIALTSISAIAGLLPITFSNPLWRGLGGAIIAGLTFSGTIMLFFIPVVYYYFFKNSKFTN